MILISSLYLDMFVSCWDFLVWLLQLSYKLYLDCTVDTTSSVVKLYTQYSIVTILLWSRCIELHKQLIWPFKIS